MPPQSPLLRRIVIIIKKLFSKIQKLEIINVFCVGQIIKGNPDFQQADTSI